MIPDEVPEEWLAFEKWATTRRLREQGIAEENMGQVTLSGDDLYELILGAFEYGNDHGYGRGWDDGTECTRAEQRVSPPRRKQAPPGAGRGKLPRGT